MKLSVVIPVYNEKKTILEIIKSIKNVKLNKILKEIVIVDDFSSDGTRDILKSIKDKSIKIIYHKKNYGKGMALRTGFDYSAGNIIIIQDADLEYDPSEYPKLISPILKGENVVYGTRLAYIKRNVTNMNLLHYAGNKLLTFVTNLLYGSKITDMETGYKVFKKDVLKNINLRARRFDFEPEITAKILKNGYKIYEVPISFKARDFSEGKKITWMDGIYALVCLIKYRFVD